MRQPLCIALGFRQTSAIVFHFDNWIRSISLFIFFFEGLFVKACCAE